MKVNLYIYKKVLLATLITLLVILLTAKAVTLHAEENSSKHEFEVVDTHWEDQSGNRIDVTGGDDAYLTITLRQSNPKNIEYQSGTSIVELNKPPVAISGITVELEPTNWFIILGSRSVAVNSAVPVGNTFTVRFHVQLKDWVKPGVYKGKVKITYTLAYDGDRWYVVNENDTVEYNITVTGKPDLRVNLTGDLEPGKTTPVTVHIENKGDAGVTKVKVKLSTQAPLDINPNEEDFNELKPNSTINAVFNVTSPYNYESSSTQFTVTVTYLSPSNLTKTSQWTLNLIKTKPPRNYPILSVGAQPETPELTPGVQNKVKIVISNDGYSEAIDVQIKLSSQTASVSPDKTIILGDLKPGSSRELVFYVTPSIASAGGVVPLQYTLYYKDEKGATYQTTGSFTFNVASRYKLEPLILLSIEPHSRVIPGNKSIVMLCVRNAGMGAARNTSILVSSQNVAVNPASIFIGDIPAGQSITIPLTVLAPVTLKGGVAVLQVTVNSYDILNNLYTTQQTLTIKVSSEVKEPKLVIVPARTFSVPVGVSVIPLLLVNEGDATASHVVVKFSSIQGLSVISNSTYYIDEVKPHQIIYLKPKIYAEYSGSYSLTCSVEYRDEWFNLLEDTFSIGLQVVSKPETKVNVIVGKNYIMGGQPTKLELDLEAINGYAKDVWVKASTSELSIIGSPTRHISIIENGENVTLTYNVFAPRELIGKTANFRLEIHYIDEEGNEKVDSYLITLLVKGVVDLELIDYSIHPKNPHPGDEVGITLSLVNKGTDKARSLTSYAIVPPPLKSLGGNATYIGDVDVGSIIPVTLSVLIPSNCAPGDYTVRFKLTFTDSFNQPYVKYYSVVVHVTPAPKVEVKKHLIPIKTLAVALAAVAAGVILFVLYRRR